MNALATPQSNNITPLHPRLCTHCHQKPVYAPKAMYCGTSCTNKAYRARKRENRAIVALEQRLEQLLTVIEQQSEQIAALTTAMQQQTAQRTPVPVITGVTEPSASAFRGNLKTPIATDDGIKIKQSSEKNSGKNLLEQLLKATQTDYSTAVQR